MLDNTNHIILADASSNNIQLILPAASGNTGLTYIIKRIDNSGSFAVIIDGLGSETIDGVATKVLTSQYQLTTVVCDGSNWYII